MSSSEIVSRYNVWCDSNERIRWQPKIYENDLPLIYLAASSIDPVPVNPAV